MAGASEDASAVWWKLKEIQSWRGPDLTRPESAKLSPTWRMFLLGDGSPTRHLNLLTGSETAVDLLAMSPVGHDSKGAPKEVEHVPGPWLLR